LQALDFEDPEVHHRHLSHLFGLFPGHTMTLESTPDLCKAATISLYKRGSSNKYLEKNKERKIVDYFFCHEYAIIFL